MNDVSVSDDAYVDIAKEYISNNETERALEYAKNKIFLKENKADVMRLIGEKLIDTNTTKAKELFDEAFVLYKEVTEAKGEGNLKNSDIFDYRYLLKDYTALSHLHFQKWQYSLQFEYLARISILHLYYHSFWKCLNSLLVYMCFTTCIRFCVVFICMNDYGPKRGFLCMQ